MVTKFKNWVKGEKKFWEVNRKYERLVKQLIDHWDLDEEVDFSGFYLRTDYFSTLEANQELGDEIDLNMTEVHALLIDVFNNFKLYYDEMLRIASTQFLNFMHTTIDAKIKSITHPDPQFTHRKMYAFHGHDSTLSTILAAVEQKQQTHCPFSSQIFVEVWQKAGEWTLHLTYLIHSWVF